MKIGKILYNRRKELGLTQKSVGKEASVSRNHLSSIENNRENPSYDTLIAILETLDLELVIRKKRK